MRVVLPWLVGSAVVIVVGLVLTYLMLLGAAWLFLQPFAGALEVMAMGEC